MEDVERFLKCTCLKHSDDLEPEDLKDADLCDPECPVHGSCINIKE